MSVEILALKFPDVIGIYKHLSHTVLFAFSLIVSTFLSTMFDVGELLTFDNCVLKTE